MRFHSVDEIKSAIDAGKRVYWINDCHVCYRDSIGQRLETCLTNNHTIGLTHRDGETLNGEPADFYCYGLHIHYELERKDLPAQCIEDCSGPGDAEPAVTYWIDALNLTVDRENAVQWLAEFGAWEDDELAAMSDRDITMRVLWIACGNFSDGEDLVVMER